MLTVAVLGPVEVRRDGVPLAIPAGKTTEVLVRLALDAGELVRTERLIEDLWGGGARNTVQSKVSALRRALGDPALVQGGPAGYTLAIGRGQVDALEVLRLAEVDGDTATALAMFRGDLLLPGAGDGAWVAPHRTRLREARLRLTEDSLAARIDLGAAGELVGDLEGLVEAHPLRERLWALLITALYRSGRQADALTAYRRVQRRLADELGVDPGRELRDLEQRVLRQDHGLDAPAPGNLPGVSASLVGRDAELTALTRATRDHRLVTVVGPAGVGKTRLAVEVARSARPAGGAWLVRLDGVRPGAPLWPAVGEAFGVSAATRAMVLDRLRGIDLLLVLDNCEHLLDEVADLVSTALSAAPGLRVLATSQVPSGVDGEVGFPLEPLTLADSITLFTERATQQRRSLVVDADTRRSIAQVCRALDGLPLAIELAGARAKALSIDEIARRLDDRFALLVDPTSRRPERRRTLRAAIAWSYDLLFPDDQRGLWAFACFAGGAPLTAFEHVLAALDVPATAAVDIVDRLVDRSLVAVDGDATRYRLLDSVHAYSLERLRAAGLADVAQAAHATWLAEAADRAATGARGADQATHLATVRAEGANTDAALSWTADHDPLLGLRIANGFGWAWSVLGAGPDGARRVRAALSAADSRASEQDRATALLLAGFLEASGGDLDRATADLEEAGGNGLYLAFVRSQQGRAPEALALLADCRSAFHRDGQVWEEGVSWLLEAWAGIALGDVAQGRAACAEALRLLEPVGDQWALSHAEALLGELAQAEQRFGAAAAHLRRAADATHALGFAAAEAHHLANLGRVQHRDGDREGAVATLRLARDTARATGDPRTAALAGVRLGWVLRALGRGDQARTAVEPACRWYAAAGGGDAALLADYLLAALDADDGAPDAGRRLDDVLAAARRDHAVDVEVLALDTLARLRADEGLRAAADAVLPAARHLISDRDRD